MSALELAQSLIKIKSISPEDGGCFDLIEAELIPLGFQIEKIPELNCETLLAKFGDSGKVFCYLGHTDVVPSGPEDEWSAHPFEANVVDGELIGRGAADMKGSVAVFVEALKKDISSGKDQAKSLSFPITPLSATAAIKLTHIEVLSFLFIQKLVLLCELGAHS